jgi:hypothetical protein
MFRQGDVIITPAATAKVGTKLDRLILANGEQTGHQHQIASGEAQLYTLYNLLFIKVLSQTALLVHEQHKPINIPCGDWEIRLQCEYKPHDPQYLLQ